MPFYYTPYIILPLCSAGVSAALAVFAWHRRRIPAALPLFWLMVAMSGWSLAYSLNTAATSLAVKIFFFKTGVTFVCMVVPSLLALALESVGRREWLTRRGLALLCAIAIITLLITWTSELHSLMRYDLHLARSGPLLVLGFKNGPFYQIHFLYIIFANCLAIVLFATGFRRLPRSEWPRFALLIIATIIPLLVELLQMTPISGLSMTTSILLLSGLLYAIAIFQHRLLDLMPLARTTLFDQISVPVLVFNDRGELVDCNKAARRLSAGDSDMELPRIQRTMQFRFPLLRAKPGLGPDCDQEDYLADAVDPGRHWRVSASELTAGILRGTLVLLHDVSDLKDTERRLIESERNLRELNRDLRERVEEETRQRVDQERILANQSRLAAMGEMISAIAHQWRQPLSTLGMIVQRTHAEGAMRGLTRESLDEFKVNAMRQIRHMSDTIEEFRGFYRPEKRKEPFSPLACLSDAVRLFEPQFTGSSIVVNVHRGQEADRLVYGYPNEFKQVILNLLGNARDAILDCRTGEDTSKQGHISLQISIVEENRMFIDISDTGCGIPDDIAPKIFDPYFTTKEKSGGTGIGLYMSRMIVENSLGGRISLLRSLRGATFRIELPLEERTCII